MASKLDIGFSWWVICQFSPALRCIIVCLLFVFQEMNHEEKKTKQNVALVFKSISKYCTNETVFPKTNSSQTLRFDIDSMQISGCFCCCCCCFKISYSVYFSVRVFVNIKGKIPCGLLSRTIGISFQNFRILRMKLIRLVSYEIWLLLLSDGVDLSLENE